MLWPGERALVRLRSSIEDDARGRTALNCKDTRNAFAALLDGDLALTERAPVEVHLDQCIACWAKLEHLRSQPAPFRMLWRLRVAFSSMESFLDEAARLRRPAFLRVPSRMIPMTAAVTIMVVVATYGIQRWTEPVTAPEASPVRRAPAKPIPPPLGATETTPSSALPPAPTVPSTVSAEGPTTKSNPEPSRTSRERARPVAKAQVASSDAARAAVGAPAPKVEARAATTWVLGNSKDEQNVLPESETMRRERD